MGLPDGAQRGHRKPLVISMASLQASSGRTSMLVNLAWTLAAIGRHVLIIDADATGPTAELYLRNLPSMAPPSTPQVRRFLLPIGFGAIDILIVDESGLARELERADSCDDYDIILTDQPAVRTSAQVKAIAAASDIAIICFRPLPDYISGAWTLAEQLRRASGDRVRIILAPTQQVRRQGQDPLGRLTQQIEDAATSSVTDAEPPPVQLIRIPYRLFDVDTALGALAMDPASAEDRTQAYDALATAVLGEPISGIPPVPLRIRRRYLSFLRLIVDDVSEPIGIVYLPQDRAWAEWIAAQIRSAGSLPAMVPVDNRALPVPTCPEVIVVTGRVPDNREAVMLQEAINRVRTGGTDHLISWSIRRDNKPFPVDGAHLRIQVGRQGKEETVAHLRAALGLFSSTESAGLLPGSGPTYPPDLPIRNPDFLGRGVELETMRNWLLDRPYAQLIMSGDGGTGKSEIACEYAHRFADSYEVVWWVPAHTRRAVRQNLARLAAPVSDVGVDPANAAVSWLSKRDRPWLLIFDSADDLSQLADLIPRSESGHVIVTTRAAVPPESGDHPGTEDARIQELLAPAGKDLGLADGPVLRMRIGRFDDDDALLLVKEWVRSLNDDQATRMAGLVGHLPIALRLAVAWTAEAAEGQVHRGISEILALNWCVDELSRSIGERIHHVQERAAETGRTLEDPVTAALLEVTLESMETLGENLDAQRCAVRLAQLCAFLSPERVSLELLCSQSMLHALSDDSSDHWLQQDGLQLHQALWAGHRYGIFEVNRAAEGKLRMHRMLASLMRSIMPTSVSQARQRSVLRALMAYAPSDAERETVTRSERLTELSEHLEPSGALDSDDWDVRRWVTVQSRFAYRWGDISMDQAESERAAAVAERWRAAFSVQDPLYARLLVQQANLERRLGRPQSAHALDSEALRIQHALHDTLHPRALITRRGLAADLRALGDFYNALAEDQATYEGFRQILGPDHAETLMAANNLVLSQFICGRPAATAPFQQETADRWRRVYGPESPSYVKSMLVQAAILRDLGHHAEAEEALWSTLRAARSKGIAVVDDLLLASGRAASRRVTGSARDARQQHRNILDSCRQILGPDHQVTLSIQVQLALDGYKLEDHPEAAVLMTDAISRYETHLPADHPFVELCRSNLAVFLRSTGQLTRAVNIGAKARSALDSSLTDIHPWTLAAELNHANHLAAADRGREAQDLRRSVLARCAEPVELEHPVNAKAHAHAQAGMHVASQSADTLFEVPVL